MNTTRGNKYFIVKDKNGDDYFCPLNAVQDGRNVSDREFDECVEKDVVERYSGNIEIEKD